MEEVKAWFNEGAEDHGLDTIPNVPEAAPSGTLRCRPPPVRRLSDAGGR